jgi:hypothetical protein
VGIIIIIMAGRKPIAQQYKRQPVTIYAEQRIIDLFGGKSGLRQRIDTVLETEAAKRLKMIQDGEQAFKDLMG